MTNWNETQSVHMVLGAPGWFNGVAADTDVTLVLTLQISDTVPDWSNCFKPIFYIGRGSPVLC